MGSGLILLVIVGAWLAVLVPMGLRSHDSSTSLSSVDRFSTAMRVLSRRAPSSVDRRSLLVPRRAPATAPLGRTPAPVAPPVPVAPRPALSLAVRRRRTLLTLLALSAAGLLGGLVGPAWLLPLGGGVLLLAVAFVVHCRRQAVLRAARRPAAPRRAVVWPVPVHVAGVQDRMPRRPAALTRALPAPAARYEDLPPAAAVVASRRNAAWAPAPAAPVSATAPAAPAVPAAAARRRDADPVVFEPPAAAVGEPWSPVPVPVPTYVHKAKAPVRPTVVLDLTQPGKWSAGLVVEDDLEALDAVADDGELDGILERRRASGGW